MGLDVYLYRFPGLDGSKLEHFFRKEEEFWGKEWKVWESLRSLLGELNLPSSLLDGPPLDNKIEYPSAAHTRSSFQVGSWDNGFSYFHNIVSELLKRDFYEVFPEAVGDPCWIKPDWHRARYMLNDFLSDFQRISPHDPVFCKLVCFDPEDEFAEFIDDFLVMIETIDCVLAQNDHNEFLLNWSA